MIQKNKNEPVASVPKPGQYLPLFERILHDADDVMPKQHIDDIHELLIKEKPIEAYKLLGKTLRTSTNAAYDSTYVISKHRIEKTRQLILEDRRAEAISVLDEFMRTFSGDMAGIGRFYSEHKASARANSELEKLMYDDWFERLVQSLEPHLGKDAVKTYIDEWQASEQGIAIEGLFSGLTKVEKKGTISPTDRQKLIETFKEFKDTDRNGMLVYDEVTAHGILEEWQ